MKYVFQILFKVSNNEAEYEALLHGLRLVVSLGIKRLLVYGDSLLIIQQVNKEWDINNDTTHVYVEEIRKLENKFSGLEIHHIDRNNNVGADVLSKLGSTRAAVLPGVFVHELLVTPRPTDITGEFENLSNEAEEICRSELKKCLRVPEEQAPLKGLDVQEDLTYNEHPVIFFFFETVERVTRDQKKKICRMQWSYQTEKMS